jgi:hypothetical protein
VRLTDSRGTMDRRPPLARAKEVVTPQPNANERRRTLPEMPINVDLSGQVSAPITAGLEVLKQYPEAAVLSRLNRDADWKLSVVSGPRNQDKPGGSGGYARSAGFSIYDCRFAAAIFLARRGSMN